MRSQFSDGPHPPRVDGEQGCSAKNVTVIDRRSCQSRSIVADGCHDRNRAAYEFKRGCVSVSADLRLRSASLARPMFGVRCFLAMQPYLPRSQATWGILFGLVDVRRKMMFIRRQSYMPIRSSPTHSTSRLTARGSRFGFTLVELLVSILVLSILASLFLFAMSGAMNVARTARTKATIAKIDRIISDLWDDYQSRRVPIRIPPGTNPPVAARMRLDALRELMRLELPDRIADVELGNSFQPRALEGRPALSLAYERFAQSKPKQWTVANQNAECLYLIVSMWRSGNRNGIDLFSDSEIGDTDIGPDGEPDYMPEILDGWGNPIRFLRWAPGFNSAKQNNDPNTAPHDPFDPRELDPNAFTLFPVIMSAGPDREWDFAFTVTDSGGNELVDFHAVNNNPFAQFGGESLGTPSDTNNDMRIDAFFDNIHNHLIETR